MENKINVAKILKDCPKGMELNCTMYNNAYLESVNENVDYPIRIKIGKTDVINLTKEGHWNKFSNAKCVIFPKGKTTWEGFQRPFKDGDILATNDGKFIAIIKKNGGKYYVCCHYTNGAYFETDGSGWFDRLATEEEKQKLFDAIKANGCRWDEETKTLEKLIEPKFKVGDRIEKYGEYRFTIADVKDECYLTKCGNKIPIGNQDDFNLISNKFDITALTPFDKVLVRDHEDCIWRADFYSHYEQNQQYWFVCVGDAYKQCIPYNEETANLLSTDHDCPDKYKIWKDE